MKLRKMNKIFTGKPIVEGAGVHLKRVFSSPEVSLFDPFLLMDDFHSSKPKDYMAGFPMHPHRGIETITYMLKGSVSHRDSMGNHGLITGGDIQWMTAGSGIIHEEMPEQSEPELWGFQLWANLPSSHKMMPPRYQSIEKTAVPEVSPKKNVRIKVICGEINGIKGPVQDLIIDPEYLDVSIGRETAFDYPIKKGYTLFTYVIEGEGFFDEAGKQKIFTEQLVLFEDGDQIRVTTKTMPVRFLLVSGKPIKEPIAWQGPIVMNTQAELKTAFKEYKEGLFIKPREN